MQTDHFEIERKYLIQMPDRDYLESAAAMTQIVQTYLNAEPGVTARVRKRGSEGAWAYTHTQKMRISDVRRYEDEREIDEKEYDRVVSFALRLGVENGFIQEGGTARESFIPAFDYEGI